MIIKYKLKYCYEGIKEVIKNINNYKRWKFIINEIRYWVLHFNIIIYEKKQIEIITFEHLIIYILL